MKWLAIAALAPLTAAAAELKPATVAAFDNYIQQTEQRLANRKNFLWAEENQDRVKKARQGQVVVEAAGVKGLIEVKDGLVHDWVGTVFVPGVTVQQTVTQL